MSISTQIHVDRDVNYMYALRAIRSRSVLQALSSSRAHTLACYPGTHMAVARDVNAPSFCSQDPPRPARLHASGLGAYIDRDGKQCFRGTKKRGRGSQERRAALRHRPAEDTPFLYKCCIAVSCH